MLTPEGITDAARWLTQLRQLVSERSLFTKVRFIIVETEPAPGVALAVELAGLGERVDVRLEAADSRIFLGKIINGMKTAPLGADAIRVAGMAGPREAPPPRPGRQAPPTDVASAELEGVGMNGALANAEVVKALRIETMSASLALQEGRNADAVQHDQDGAAAHCLVERSANRIEHHTGERQRQRQRHRCGRRRHRHQQEPQRVGSMRSRCDADRCAKPCGRGIRPNGHAVDIEYDALARRVAKTYRGKVTRWIWDGNVPLHEWVERAPDAVDEAFARPVQVDDAVAAGEKALKAMLAGRPANGPPTRPASVVSLAKASAEGTSDSPITWLFEPGTFTPLAKLVDGASFSFVVDHLGVPLGMYDAAGNPVWSAQHDSHGRLTASLGSEGACPFRFPGQYEDAETGLFYNRFRYYDPELSQYISQDPIRITGGLGLYAYVADPNVDTDPYGLIGNGQLGAIGEDATRSFLEKNGYEVLGPMQNNSGHGVDLVVRDQGGNLRVVEVKANSSRMSPAQNTGPDTFATSRAQSAKDGKGAWGHPSGDADELADLIQAEKAEGRSIKGLVARVEVDPVTGEVKSVVLSIWRCK